MDGWWLHGQGVGYVITWSRVQLLSSPSVHCVPKKHNPNPNLNPNPWGHSVVPQGNPSCWSTKTSDYGLTNPAFIYPLFQKLGIIGLSSYGLNSLSISGRWAPRLYSALHLLCYCMSASG